MNLRSHTINPRRISTGRKALVTVALSVVAFGAIVGPASADTAPSAAPLKCVGAAEQKAALSYGVQAINSHIAALNARRTAAQSIGRAEIVARIDLRLAEAQARLTKVTTHQSKLATRCP